MNKQEKALRTLIKMQDPDFIVTYEDIKGLMPDYMIVSMYNFPYKGLGPTPFDQFETTMLYLAAGIELNDFIPKAEVRAIDFTGNL